MRALAQRIGRRRTGTMDGWFQKYAIRARIHDHSGQNRESADFRETEVSPMKVVKKRAKPRKPSSPRRKDWRDAIRMHLAKVPEVDAVFACKENGTVHVYSVVENIRQTNYKRLLKQEGVIEKAFPSISFEFHTWVHQGREPSTSGPLFSELVYLR
jgi:hypothetical protein